MLTCCARTSALKAGHSDRQDPGAEARQGGGLGPGKLAVDHAPHVARRQGSAFRWSDTVSATAR